jgi:hypothetical protein
MLLSLLASVASLPAPGMTLLRMYVIAILQVMLDACIAADHQMEQACYVQLLLLCETCYLICYNTFPAGASMSFTAFPVLASLLTTMGLLHAPIVAILQVMLDACIAADHQMEQACYVQLLLLCETCYLICYNTFPAGASMSFTAFPVLASLLSTMGLLHAPIGMRVSLSSRESVSLSQLACTLET